MSIGSVIFLNPGQFSFYVPRAGVEPPAQLYTLLGSSVSVVLWHPEKRIAAMSHAILPGRTNRANQRGPDGRYCDEVFDLIQRELHRLQLAPTQFSTYLVGGGQMHSTDPKAVLVGNSNIEATRALTKSAGFVVRGEHVGAQGYRKLAIDLTNGQVTVTHNQQSIQLD